MGMSLFCFLNRFFSEDRMTHRAKASVLDEGERFLHRDVLAAGFRFVDSKRGGGVDLTSR